jgi:type VI secretion system secreted protein VgrG
VDGTINNAGSFAAQAGALAAYNTLTGEATGAQVLTGDLGGRTLMAGVYSFSSSAQLTGTLTLSGNGEFDFLIGSTLTTASSSIVSLINGAQADDVFWQVGTSATLGTTTSFEGTILADQSISLDGGASIYGRALALNAAVTLINNDITMPGLTPVPEPTTMVAGALLVLPFGMSALRMLRKRQVA